MKNIFILFSLLLSSCSSFSNREKVGSVLGALVVGSVAGLAAQKLSPNRESRKTNMIVFGGLGLIGGGVIGSYMGSEPTTNVDKKDDEFYRKYQYAPFCEDNK